MPQREASMPQREASMPQREAAMPSAHKSDLQWVQIAHSSYLSFRCLTWPTQVMSVSVSETRSSSFVCTERMLCCLAQKRGTQLKLLKVRLTLGSIAHKIWPARGLDPTKVKNSLNLLKIILTSVRHKSLCYKTRSC